MGQLIDLSQSSRAILDFPKVLAALAARVLTPLGGQLAQALLPAENANQALLLQRQTSEGKSLLSAHGLPALDGISDIFDLLEAAHKGGALDVPSLLGVAECLRSLNLLHSYLADHLASDSPLEFIRRQLVPFPDLQQELTSKFDREGNLLDSASPLLGSLRRRVHQARMHLTQQMERLAQSLHAQGALQEPLPTFREGRPCIALRSDRSSQVKGIVHGTSTSGLTLFVEPLEIVPQANTLRRLEGEEEEEIARILAELSHSVGRTAPAIKENLHLCAQADLIFARAGLSADWDCSEPEFSPEPPVVSGACPEPVERVEPPVVSGVEPRLELHAARHPLLPPHQVVPIDVELGGEFTTMVITGPNTGGKTVALKTIGLLCLMAYSGLHIPAARGSRVPFLPQVFADIGDEQSIEQSLSTFSSHISKIVRILEAAEDNSLVLLDEIGAGTDPEEGAALAISILKALQAKGPLVAASTHHSALKTFAHSEPGFRNASVEFDTQTLSPTYRLRLGLPGPSQALVIAERLGLPRNVVERAADFLDVEKVRFEEVLTRVTSLERKLEFELASLKDEASALAADKEEVDRIRRELEQKRKKALTEGFLEAREIVEQADSEANRILAQIRQQQAEGKSTQEAKEKLANLRKRLARLHQELVPPPQPRPTAGPPLAGAASPPRTVKPFPGESPALSSLRSRKMFSTPQEISVRGLTWDQAQPIIEKYLDDAFLAGLSPIRIIHGRGTGSLRAAVRHLLSSHPLVKSFHQAESSEGGLGVTVVEL